MRHQLAALALVAGIAGPAQALVLDYPGIFNAADYGDVAGLLDVTHTLATQHWATGYDDLVGVAWGGSQAGGETASVRLASVNGALVTLQGFDLGIWSSGRGVPETVNVFEIGNAVALDTFTISENSNRHWSFDINRTSTTGFIIAWTSPWWVAIDNVAVTTAVPEPATSALMLLGVLGLAAAARRR